MMHISEILKNIWKFYYSVIVSVLILILLELPILETSRALLSDESWYSHPSYNLITFGKLTNTNMGFGGNATIIYNLYLSIYFFIFGTSVFIARFSSLILGLTSLFIIKKILKSFNISEFNILITLLFFVSSNLYLSIFKYARPEALTFVFSVLLLLIVIKYAKNGFKFKYILMVMILIFLSVNTHPFSLIIISVCILIVAYYIFINRSFLKFYYIFLLLVSVIIALLFVFYMYVSNNNMSVSYALQEDLLPRSAAGTSFLSGMISKINETLIYYIYSNRIITFLPHLLLIFTGFSFYKINKNIFKVSVIGLLSILISYATLSAAGFMLVFVYIFIFSFIIIALLLEHSSNRKLIYKFIVTITIIIMIINVVAYYKHSFNSFDRNISKTFKNIDSYLPNKSVIISGTEFWFISPEKNIKNWNYFKDSGFVNDSIFYIIDCDKFKQTSKVTVIDYYPELMNYIENNMKINEIFYDESKIYGKITVFKAIKEKK